ncbi:MAG TPA: SulP family inorganic anion transporter [Thermoleophilia bacterium]|nr:SulP family inorganic anion transporter [Thermoleophilia bacterium]
MSLLKGRRYFDRRSVGRDAAGGLTLGIESIPDAMASGVLAGVNPIYALYAVMLATPVGALFSSSVFMSVQTTSAMSLLVADVPQVHGGADAAGALFMLTLMTGVIMLAMGLLKLGSYLRFVPNAVLTGFINGVAVLIILGQLGELTGTSPEGGNKVEQAGDLLRNWQDIDPRAFAVGLTAIVLIVALQNTRLKSWGMVVALVMASLLVPLFNWGDVALVTDVASIPDSLPLPTLPDFSALPALIVPAIALAFVGLVQGSGISQSFTNPDGRYPSASGDFVGQGAANVAASLFQGMPVGGSLSATALVHNAGVRSRAANIIAGVTIAVVLLLFSGLVGKLAMPALAGLLIVVGFQTLKPHQIDLVVRTGWLQAVVVVTTFVLTLLVPLQYAVLIGVAVSILLHWVKQSNQMVLKEWVFPPGQALPREQDPPDRLPGDHVTVITPYGRMFFATARLMEEQLPEVTTDSRRAVLILNLREHDELGSTFLGMFDRYAESLREHGAKLMLAEVGPHLYGQLHNTGRLRALKPRNVLRRSDTVDASIVEAIDTADEWIEAAAREVAEAGAENGTGPEHPAETT